jgi:hypothetical protein
MDYSAIQCLKVLCKNWWSSGGEKLGFELCASIFLVGLKAGAAASMAAILWRVKSGLEISGLFAKQFCEV